jgi:predicted ATPase
MSDTSLISTPDQRLRVFVSSTMEELATERRAVRDAVTSLRLVPVMFELGARAHPPRAVYRAYLAQSQVFVGIYWQRYGWVAPGEQVSGLEDEYRLSAGLPQLLYVKSPAPDREPRLTEMLTEIKNAGGTSYQYFTDAGQLQRLVEDDLAVLLSERFIGMQTQDREPAGDAFPSGTVPVPPTPLIGRETEMAAVEALACSQDVRLVTLTGPGGAGKSRLALATAQRLQSSFADGARFIELGSVASAGQLPGALAAGLGLNTSGSSRQVADLASYLRPRRLLLVLDNFEQVTEAAPLLAGLLAAAPGLKLLVTSRSVLRLNGEHEFPVPPLSVPPSEADREVEVAAQYASVRLFAERARAVAAGFELTSQNIGAVAEICRRLDGLPLAIELAAARVKLLPPQALLARLGDRLSVLNDGPRDLPERQRTMRNTLDWSFALLSADQQALFARLAVFAGSFGLPAAEAIGGGDATEPVIDILNSLIDSSLVQAEARGDEPRFRLLETIRDYALQQLRASGSWDEARTRHAEYFMTLAEPAETELRGEGQVAWLNRLEAELDNLSTALSWLIEAGQLDHAITFSWDTWRFWWLRGHVDELARFWDRLMARQPELTPREQAMALAGTGYTAFADGDRDRARPVFEQSLPLFRAAGDPLSAAQAAAHLGHVLAAQHDDKQADQILQQARNLLKQTDSAQRTEKERLQYLLDVALVDNFLGQIQLSQANHDRAAQLFSSALDAARGAADQFAILISLYDLALSCTAREDLDGAAKLLREGLALAADVGDEPTAAYYLRALGGVARQAGDPGNAASLTAAASVQLQASGSGWLHAYVPPAIADRITDAELRHQLGETAYEEAAAHGRSLTGLRAIRQALQSGEFG